MSRFYHPQESAPMDAGGGGPASGIEMSNAGLSAGVEMHIQAPVEATGSQLAQQAFDFQSAGVNAVSQTLRPGLELQTLLPNTSIGGFEATAFTAPPVGGADSALMAGLVPGANEPLSPLIQLILRMPGAMGLMHSVVDFFAAFFHHATHNMFNLLDPSFLAHQAQGALGDLAKGAVGHGSALGHGAVGHIGLSQHFPVSMSLLPGNAPIFQSLGFNGVGPMGSDLLSAKLNGSLNGLGQSGATDFGPGSFSSDNFQVSGQLDPTKAQFEQMGAGGSGFSANPHNPQLAGPSLSDSVGKGHLASNTRLFSDQITSLKGNQQFVSNASVPNTPMGSSGSMPQMSQSSSLPSSFNVNSNPLAQGVSSSPAVARVEDGLLNGVGTPAEAGYSMGSPSGNFDGAPDLGPSGAVSNRLGGQQLLADSRGVDTFRPSYSGMEGGRSLSDMQPRSADAGYGSTASDTTSAAAKGATVGGLKAKQLSLDGIDKAAQAKGSAASHSTASHTTSSHASNNNSSSSHAAPKPAAKASDAPTHAAHSTMDGISHGHKAGHHEGSSASDHVSHKGGHSSAKAHDNVSHRVTPKVQYDEHARQLASAKADAARQVAQPQPVEQYGQQPVDQTRAGADPNQQAPAEQPVTDANGNPVEQVEAQPAEYTVKSGDCLWNIAKDRLGDGLKWHEIYDMNKDVLGSNPDLIMPGTTIHLPGSNELASQVGGEMTKYVVKPGDNLWNISKDMMGGGEKWGQLYQANHDLIGANPRLIFPGQELNIPSADGASGVMANSGVDPSQTMAAAQTGGQPPVGAGQEGATTTAAAPDAAPQGQTVEQGVASYDPMPSQQMQQMPTQQAVPAVSQPAPQMQPAQPGLPQAALPQGLPVLPAQTPTPALMTPAQAATPVADHQGATAGVVSSNMAINLADYLRKNR